MKVKEIIKTLKKMPPDAEVYYLDTFWRSEGWGEHADEDAWNMVNDVLYNKTDNTIEIY